MNGRVSLAYVGSTLALGSTFPKNDVYPNKKLIGNMDLLSTLREGVICFGKDLQSESSRLIVHWEPPN